MIQIINGFKEKIQEASLYPTRYEQRNLTRYALTLFIIIFAFLYFFKPFGVNESELRISYLFICFLHALNPILIVYLYFSLLNYNRDKKHTDNWSLRKELFHLTMILLMIGVGSYLLRGIIYTSPENLSAAHLLEEIKNVFLAGALIFSYLIFARFYFKPNAKTNTQAEMPTMPGEVVFVRLADVPVFIKAHVKIDDFYLNPDDLLFVKAEGNYSMLTYINNGVLKTELKRISLKQLELQLKGFPNLLRCHRAYLLNIQQIAKLSGNSQGYSISFDKTDDKVPVSRAYLNVFNQVYQRASEAC